MDVKISLDTTEPEQFDRDALAMIARDLNIDLNREFESTFQSQEGASGGKGLVEFAPIILSLAGSGGAVMGLVNIFTTYLGKAPKIELELEKENGRRIKLTAENMEPDRIRETIKMMNEYLEE